MLGWAAATLECDSESDDLSFDLVSGFEEADAETELPRDDWDGTWEVSEL